MEIETGKEIPEEDEQKFEMSPEQATGLKPGILNRKKILIFVCIALSVVVCGGLLMNALKPPKKAPPRPNQVRLRIQTRSFFPPCATAP